MNVFRPILRRLVFSPFSTVVVDDQREWKGSVLLIAAFHLAKQIEKTSQRDNIGIMLPTSGLFPMAMVASWMLGRTIVPLNYLLKREELEYVIDDAELDTVITVTPMLEHFGELPDHITDLRLDKMKDKFKGFPPLRWPKSRPDDHVAALLYTSGTSGKPKGVMLTSNNLSSNVHQCVEWAQFTKKDVILGVLPQFHSFGFTVLTLLPLSVGCKVVFTARFVPKKILELMRKHRPTAFVGIPSMYNALLSAKSAQKEDFSSLRYIVSGGEPLPEAVFNGFKERFGITINEGYGLTETAPVTNWCRPQDHKPKSVGMAVPDVEVKIQDADGKRLGPNEDGEVCLKGPNIMKGYYKLPEETAKVFDDDGFFHTGDMGRLDDDGHLYITGRYKEMLIVGGENVFPREIEEVLNAHETVHASAVIGMQDPSRGEVPLAFVELEEGHEFDETALRKHCRDKLAGYKVPREIRVIKELPRNPTGKIMRRELSASMTTDDENITETSGKVEEAEAKSKS
jgi:long-chain acyl-CoA synthetase